MAAHAPGLATNLRVDGDRLWASLMEMARIGATPRGGCNRQALTDEDRRGRDLFVGWCRAAGCEVSIDAIGNIFARRAGTDPDAAAVLIGSHLDTQPTGGRFDGVYGVLAGLEVVRTLSDAGRSTRRPIVVASWTNEEGARFPPAMMGSGVCAGDHALEDVYRHADRNGVTVKSALEAIGYLGSADPPSICAAFEAHIEQGPILEREAETIGVVTGIQGCWWLDLTFTGAAAHAGTTPMEARRDPWRAALPALEAAFEAAAAYAPDGRCTVGDVAIEPGSRNTVPERLRLSFDLRHPDDAVLTEMRGRLETVARRQAARHGLGLEVEEKFRMAPTSFDPALVDLVEQAAEALGHRRRRMISGAGHDSLHVARLAPTAMIFVPCAGGLSHNEAEDAQADDLRAGADVLLLAAVAAADRP